MEASTLMLARLKLNINIQQMDGSSTERKGMSPTIDFAPLATICDLCDVNLDQG